MGSIFSRWPVNPKKPDGEFTKEERLWLLRTGLEGGHRMCIQRYSVAMPYRPSVKDIDHLPEMEDSDFIDTCSKSVPVYMVPHPQGLAIRQTLHNYIYRRWFRPYRTDFECQRFICKFIKPRGLTPESTPSQATVDSLMSMNRAICTEVEARRRVYEQRFALGQLGLMRGTAVQDPRRHILQPLFHALLIIICAENYHNEDSRAVGRIPVFLVRTGIEDGLSAPVTFDSIADKIDGHTGEAGSATKTTLETAIDFVMGLEAREAAAFGLQPDPVAAWKNELTYVRGDWKEILGDELLMGPSSKFVDTAKYPEWRGEGEDYESDIMVVWEQRQFRRNVYFTTGNYQA
ncbi:hypothetical protein GGR52DRAFT_565506 [Hypoxylon sp. FL1284]|nr:hypothetical protein GGR52DRAFT_565506 [Hypoxylon sp. FL1284]